MEKKNNVPSAKVIENPLSRPQNRFLVMGFSAIFWSIHRRVWHRDEVAVGLINLEEYFQQCYSIEIPLSRALSLVESSRCSKKNSYEMLILFREFIFQKYQFREGADYIPHVVQRPPYQGKRTTQLQNISTHLPANNWILYTWNACIGQVPCVDRSLI